MENGQNQSKSPSFSNFPLKSSEFEIIWWILKLSIEPGADLIDFVTMIPIPTTNSDQKSWLKDNSNPLSV